MLLEQLLQEDITGGEKPSPYIIFSCGGPVFAINYENVREIIPCMDTVLINGAPEYIRGLINYNGEICPVVTICPAAASLPASISAKSCFIMVNTPQTGRGAVAILADSFLGSFSISNADIKPRSGDFLTAADGSIKGTALCPQGTAAVIEPGNFFKWMDWIEM
jgi:chemotaxis signal transduction protein